MLILREDGALKSRLALTASFNPSPLDLMNDLDSTQRDARILQERRGTAAHPRRGFMAELTREDRHWSDLCEQRPQLRREHLLLCNYKPRYLEILDEEGHKVERIRIPPEGLSEEALRQHLHACGSPTRTLRARIRRRGGAYYGCKTFKPPRRRLDHAPASAPPAPRPAPTPAPAPTLAPAPTPPTPPASRESGLGVLVGALGLALVGAGGYALVHQLRAARAREARRADRDLLLEHRDALLAALAQRPRCHRSQEAMQRLARLTPEDQEPDDLLWIVALALELQPGAMMQPRSPHLA